MDLAVDDQAGVVKKDSVTREDKGAEGRGQGAGRRERAADSGQRSAVSSQQEEESGRRSAGGGQQEERVGVRPRPLCESPSRRVTKSPIIRVTRPFRSRAR